MTILNVFKIMNNEEMKMRAARHRKFMEENNSPMTVGELIAVLETIEDNSTPVYLESGEPVHYTCHGMNQNETRFFIGVM